MLHKNGFNVLLIDMRDHWQSTLEDGRVSAGQKEWRDVLAAWNYLVEDKGVNETKIGIHGTSMGAATTAIAFAQEPQIQAAFLDSSFSSMEKIMVEELQFQGYPEFLKDAAVFAGIVSTGENIIEHEPLSATQSISNRHLFITQSTIDSRIRLHHGEKLCEVARENSDGGSVNCWLEESAFEFKNEDGEQGSLAHVSLMITQSELYEQRLVAFFEQALF